MNSELADNIVIEILRDMLGKLGDIVGALDALSLRVMAVTAAASRIETHADEVALDLAYQHHKAAEVPESADAGSRADAASLPTPAEKWEN